MMFIYDIIMNCEGKSHGVFEDTISAAEENHKKPQSG
jgi:hypothetical protein